MAITKIVGAIHPRMQLKDKLTGLKNCIKYIKNPQKTNNGQYVGANNCQAATAGREMEETFRMYGKYPNDENDRVGYHFIISFPKNFYVPEDIMMKVLRDFVNEYLNEYEAVYAVHNDGDHMHGHIVFSSLNIYSGKKFRYEDGDWAKYIQPIVDRICQKYGLPTLFDDTGMTPEEHEAARKNKLRHNPNLIKDAPERTKRNKYHKDSEQKYSWNEHVANDIDYAISISESYEDFENKMVELGYLMKYGNSEKYGKYLKVKAPGMSIFRKTYQLGSDYSLASIKERIQLKNRPLPEYVLPDNYRLIIPVKYYVRLRKHIPLNPALKRYYRRLYRLGIKPRYVKSSYIASKEAVERLDRVEKEYNLIIQYDAYNLENATSALATKKQELDKLYKEKEALEEAHKAYSRIIYAYRRVRGLEKYNNAYYSGETEYQEKSKEYNKYLSKLETYGYTGEQIENYIKGHRTEMKEINAKIKECEKYVEIAEEMVDEYSKEAENDEIDKDVENFFDSVFAKKDRVIQ